MQDIVFVVVGRRLYEFQEEIKKLNKFLKENEDYEIKSVTPIASIPGNRDDFTGMTFVLSERRIKRIKEVKNG